MNQSANHGARALARGAGKNDNRTGRRLTAKENKTMEKLAGQCGYVCFYNGKRKEVYADSQYAAQRIAAELFGVKPKFSYKVSVTLCERADGSEVVHTAN